MNDCIWDYSAIEKQIDHGWCWEYCFAGIGGAVDALNELTMWIWKTKKFLDIEEFHKVCEECVHYQWSN